MHTTSYKKLASHLKAGRTYRREMLLPFSKAIDRDLMKLTLQGVLEKVGGGLYYKPTLSRFGNLPPRDDELVKRFLRDDVFLLYSWNQYNTLGLGLTQLYNQLVIYNYKRHGLFQLAGKTFDFRRPARGFPKEITREFLLVDLVNNLNELAEDMVTIKMQIKQKWVYFDHKKVVRYIKQYGKIATQRFFEEISH